jgi:ADP-heptose:LPS heptosyltransferase
MEHWQKLIQILANENFVLFGGPEDHFLEDLRTSAPDRVYSFAGKTSLRETAALISQCDLIVTNDTGPMHFDEQLAKPTIALMGPAPFGFPSRTSTLVKERLLPCRPCSKHGQGPCRNQNFHECLRSISPDEVAEDIRRYFKTGSLK